MPPVQTMPTLKGQSTGGRFRQATQNRSGLRRSTSNSFGRRGVVVSTAQLNTPAVCGLISVTFLPPDASVVEAEASVRTEDRCFENRRFGDRL